MASAPLVGITCEAVHGKSRFADYALYCDHRYAEAVKEAGGHPVLLPIAHRKDVLQRYLQGISGLVIVGGDDVDPRLYGEEPQPGTEVMFEKRLRFEKWLYSRGKARKLPILAICYGMQLLNVLEGGSLHQDIDDPRNLNVDHRGKKGDTHRVNFKAGTRLANIVRVRSAEVPTEHHQSIDRVAKGFVVAAEADDGVIEAIEHPRRPHLLAVQWHPERSLRHPVTRRVFANFVQHCRDFQGAGSSLI